MYYNYRYPKKGISVFMDKKNILLIDDDAVVRDMIKDSLEKDYNVLPSLIMSCQMLTGSMYCKRSGLQSRHCPL